MDQTEYDQVPATPRETPTSGERARNNGIVDYIFSLNQNKQKKGGSSKRKNNENLENMEMSLAMSNNYQKVNQETFETRPTIEEHNFFDEIKGMFHTNDTDQIDPEEDSVKFLMRQTIQRLLQRKLRDEDGLYLEVCEMNPFEKIRVYKDNYPFLRLRKMIWLVHSGIVYLAQLIAFNPLFEFLSLFIILLNSVFLALEDPTKEVQEAYLEETDGLFLYFYTFEMTVKILAQGFILPKDAYMREYWYPFLSLTFRELKGNRNILDFVIVTTAWVPVFIGSTSSKFSLTSLRSLRVLRPLRTITSLRELRSLIMTILGAIPKLIQVLIVFGFMVGLFAITGVQIFSGAFKYSCFQEADGIREEGGVEPCGNRECPEGYFCGKGYENPNDDGTHFDYMPMAVTMVFIVVTLEGWTEIMRYAQKAVSSFAVAYFILIVFIGAFFLVNLTLAVLMSEYNEKVDAQKQELAKEIKMDKKNSLLQLAQAKEGEKKKRKTHKRRLRKFKGVSLPNFKKKLDDFLAVDFIQAKNSKKEGQKSSKSKGKGTKKRSHSKEKSTKEAQSPKIKKIGSKKKTAKVEINERVQRNLTTVPFFIKPKEAQSKRKNSGMLTTQNGSKDEIDMEEEIFFEQISKMKNGQNSEVVLDDKKKESLIRMDLSPKGPSLFTPDDFKFNSESSEESSEDDFSVSVDSDEQRNSSSSESNPEEPMNPRGTTVEFNRRKWFSGRTIRNNYLNGRKTSMWSQNKESESDGEKDTRKINTRNTEKLMERNHEMQVDFIQKKNIDFDKAFKEGLLIIKKPEVFQKTKRRTSVLCQATSLTDEAELRQKRINNTLAKNDVNFEKYSLGFIDLEAGKKVKELKKTLGFNPKYAKVRIVYEKVFDPLERYDSKEDVLPLENIRKQKELKKRAEAVIRSLKLQMIYQFKEVAPIPQDNEPKRKNFTTMTTSTLSKRGQVYLGSCKPFEVLPFSSEERRLDFYLEEAIKIKRPKPPEDNSEANKQKTYSKVFNYTSALEARAKWDELPAPVEFSGSPETDIQELYFAIKAKDMMTKRICEYNNSMNDILSNKTTYSSKLQRIVDKLNLQNPQQWEAGLNGVVLAFRRWLVFIMESKPVDNFLLICVLSNTLVLALNGLTTESQEDALEVINTFFTFTFGVEFIIKLAGYGPKEYVRDFFRVFDGIIVIFSFVELSFDSSGGSAISSFRVLRSLRVLKISRVFRSIKFMKIIFSVVSDPGFLEKNLHVTILLFLFIFIFTLVGMKLFGGKFPGSAPMDFDSFTNSFMTVFQVLTMENWQAVLYDGFLSDANNFVVTIYLVIWIFIGNYIFLNLFLGILLDAFGDSIGPRIEELWDEDQELAELLVQLKGENTPKKQDILRKGAVYESGLGSQTSLPDFQNVFVDEMGKNVGTTNELESQTSLKITRSQTSWEIKNMSKSKDQKPLLESLLYFSEKEESEMQMMSQKKKRERNPDPFFDVSCQKSLFLFSKGNLVRKMSAAITSHRHFESVILVIIILSSLKLSVETYLDYKSEDQLQKILIDIFEVIDKVLNVLFCIEMVLKIIKYGFVLCPDTYLRDNWSKLDFIIVISAFLDWSISNYDIGYLKILRLLRTLRPLRFISHNENMKVVVSALIESFSGIINVCILIFFVWVMFAILAVNLLEGQFHYCDVSDIYGISKAECLAMGKEWKNFPYNFDNIINAMQTLFVVSSLEGWPDILKAALDANSEDEGPIENNNTWAVFYFFFLVMLSSFFLMNLFVAVIFFQYNEEREEIINSKFQGLDNKQKKWIIMLRLVPSAKPKFAHIIPPVNKIRKMLFATVQHSLFEAFITVCIVLNILTMGISYDGSTTLYDQILTEINMVFTVIFIFECILKLLALGVIQYSYSNWNKFDFLIVAASLIDLVMTYIGMDGLGVGPQLTQIMRVFRIMKLFKVMKSKYFDGVFKIFQTILFSLPSLLNVIALLFLVYFIYAVMGVFLFNEAKSNSDFNTDWVNFRNFGQAMLILFRCSTGYQPASFVFPSQPHHTYPNSLYDLVSMLFSIALFLCLKCFEAWLHFFVFGISEDWAMIMSAYRESSNYLVATIFFLSFCILSTFIMINMFVLIIIEEFETYYIDTSNPLLEFGRYLEHFREVWNGMTIETKGAKLKEIQLFEFFISLEEPMGKILKIAFKYASFSKMQQDSKGKRKKAPKRRRRKTQRKWRKESIGTLITLWNQTKSPGKSGS